jgi:transketolase
MAWRVAIERASGPTFLALSRQKVPLLDRTVLAPAEGLRRGGYILAEATGEAPEAIVLASGTELALAIEARERLEEDGIPTRVVSLPSWRLFEQQDPEYRDAVLPPDVTNRVSVEAGSTFGWARWVGSAGHAIGIDRFGASAPAEVLYEQFGVTIRAVVAAVRERAGA